MGAPGEGLRERMHDRATARFGHWLRDPVQIIDFVQTVKTALAGGAAWWVATDVLSLEQAFLAPWAAVLVVHSTVYRTVSRGTQQVAATFFAVFLAFALGSTIGLGPLALGLLIFVGFMLGKVRWLRDEASTIATTGLVTLATNSIARPELLLSRLEDTAIGVAVGLAVNLLVWPPLRDRAAWSHAEQIPHQLSTVLCQVAQGVGPEITRDDVRTWVEELRRIDVHIDESWRLVWQADESGRLNPRRSQATGIEELQDLLHKLEQAVADTLSMVRTVATSAEAENDWAPEFRERWSDLAVRTADAADHLDVERLARIRDELDEFGRGLVDGSLPQVAWQEYGGVLTNLRNVHGSLSAVVELSHETGSTTRRTKRYDVERIRRLRARGGARFPDEEQGYSSRDEHSHS